MDKDKSLQKYINTPFAYTKFSKNLSLLQQDILLRVSKFLQKFVSDYYGSELKNSKDIPRPLFSAATKNNGLEEFRISFSEMGIPANNYPQVQKAVNEVLELKVSHPGLNAEGKPSILTDNIFTRGAVPINEASTSASFKLNMDVVDYVFDMAQGYISHPEDIARISNVEKMPMIYYLLRHESQNWKTKLVKLTVFEIKDYLGFVKRELRKDDNDEQSWAITDISYPKFSRFKERVLIPSIEDVMRLFKEDHIDVVFKYEPKYPGKKTTGDPEYILFTILSGKEAKDYIKEYEAEKANPKPKAVKAEAKVSDIAVPKKRGRPRKTPLPSELSLDFDQPVVVEGLIMGDRAEDWKNLVAEYGDGPLKELLSLATYEGTIDGAFSIKAHNYPAQGVLVQSDDKLRELLKKYNPDAFVKWKVGYKK